MTDTNKKKLTINDIAKLCGVGKSTVSRVLNQDPMVNEENKEKVTSLLRNINSRRQNLHEQCGIL